MAVNLKCGCKVLDNGTFELGEVCLSVCTECKVVSKLHPFGNERFENKPLIK
jgi:hypothetical protein